MLDGSTDFDFPMLYKVDWFSAGSKLSRLSNDDEVMSLLFRLSFLGGGIGAEADIAFRGDTERDGLILKDPVLPLSFSVNSFSRSVLLVPGFLSGEDDEDGGFFLPKPNFFKVLRLDLSIV